MKLKGSLAAVFFAFAFCIVSTLNLEPARAEEEKVGLAASIDLMVGRSFPQGPLGTWVGPGTAYRAKLFGGAKLPKVPWLSAVGLGIDFTYADHVSRNLDPGFYYRRFIWDWFFIPIWFAGVIHITPGMAWVVTDYRSPTQGIEDTSIRPAFMLGFGARIPVYRWIGLRLDGRWEVAFADREKRTDGSQVNVTGSFLSAFAGIDFQL